MMCMMCPLCPYKAPTGIDLSIHLATRHNDQKLANGDALHLVGHLPGRMKCWCGEEFLVGNAPGLMRDDFFDHLEANGGAEQHMIECALGLWSRL